MSGFDSTLDVQKCAQLDTMGGSDRIRALTEKKIAAHVIKRLDGSGPVAIVFLDRALTDR